MRKPAPENRPLREAAPFRGTGQVAKPPAPRRRTLWVTLLLVLPAVVCTMALFVISHRPTELCLQWEHQARNAAGPLADELVDQLDRYGRFGLPAIVRLLNAESTDTVTAACRALTARLQGMQAGATDADRETLETIAVELKATFARSDQPAPRETVDLALLLLATTGQLGLDDQLSDDLRSRLFAACEDVLRRAPPPLEAPPVPLLAMLPPAPAKTPPPPLAQIGKPEPTPMAQPIAAAKPPEPIAPPTQLSAANSAARITPPPDTQTDAAVRPASLPGATARTTSAAESKSEIDQLGRADAWTLFALLRTSHREAAAAALRIRGFSQREIELGEHLTSDDPLERRRYARELPALGITEAKPWLLRLCRDEDAEVRLSAVTIMATTNDPALQEILRQLSLDDDDDEIRRTAGRATGRIQR